MGGLSAAKETAVTEASSRPAIKPGRVNVIGDSSVSKNDRKPAQTTGRERIFRRQFQLQYARWGRLVNRSAAIPRSPKPCCHAHCIHALGVPPWGEIVAAPASVRFSAP